jgi:hypothetical protein
MSPPNETLMQYYDLQKNWRKVKRAIDRNPYIENILVRDFTKFTFGRWKKPFKSGQYPTEFESCDWQYNLFRRGRRPSFWKYTKHAACHWIVNFALELAQVVEPKRVWRIISSDGHSTVWDGSTTLFDFNFQAMGIDADKCFQLACEKEQAPGKHIRLYYAEHYSVCKD